MIVKPGVSFVAFAMFLTVYSSVFSQNKKIDSLKNIVQTGTKDTAMVHTLNALSIEVLNNENIAGSLIYAERANQLAIQLEYKKGQAYALKNIGLAAYYQGNYLEVLDHWTQSLSTFEEIQDTLGIAKLVNNLGAVYYSQGSNAKALDYYLRSLSISQKIQDAYNTSQALLNIGGLYAEMLNFDKALEYYNRIEKYRISLNSPTITVAYFMGVGEIYFEQGFYSEALNFYEEALSNTLNITTRSNILIKLGMVEFKIDNKDKANDYLKEAYRIANNNNQQLLVVQALIALGIVNQQNNFNRAIRSYKEAEVLAKAMEANDELRDIYEGLYQTYELAGDYLNAFEYQKFYLAQKDLLFNIETNDKIRGLQFDFDLEKKEDQIGLLEKEAEITELETKRQQNAFYVSLLVSGLILLLGIGVFKRYKYVKKSNKIISEEKNRSENLLLNILPEETAKELKLNGKVQAKKFESVTVLFTDFEGFTHYAQNLSPEELVNSVDYYFSKFDEIMDKYGMDKIKTIGDAYMCAGGLPFPSEDHPVKMIEAAFEIAQFIEESRKLNDSEITHFDVRIGVNTGPVVAGVVGIKKFAYDIWGDTVNVASRMESKSQAGRINISENTYKLVKDFFECEYRGEIDVKNKGMMKMYFVNGRKEQSIKQDDETKKCII